MACKDCILKNSQPSPAVSFTVKELRPTTAHPHSPAPTSYQQQNTRKGNYEVPAERHGKKKWKEHKETR